MKVGELKKQLEPLADDLHIIVVGPIIDADGDEISEAWFGLRTVTCEMDADISEDYARFGCVPLEDNDAP